MVKIGDYNRLKVIKNVDFGAYLDGGDGKEILIPARYIDTPLSPGDEIDVFVYTDSEDRLIATTEHPFARVGEFAFLQVNQVNRIGAFLDWGVSKELLVPFSEQRAKMIAGGIYLVYVYLDKVTDRVVASAKIDKFLGNVFPRYRRGDVVDALVIEHLEPGYRVIVDNLHKGMIYDNELFHPLEIGESVKAHVKQVRDDGKIDLSPGADTGTRVRALAEKIYYLMDAAGGSTSLTDNSDPAEIKSLLGCSKKDFKKAVGYLLKNKIVETLPGGMRLIGQLPAPDA
ncbi:MAG: GntR family transcriptional regulator [Muribaculaceae bacterium]|nr:GntR family transcriptional regulator [Muribaculaceae bacterium]